jgi:HK97 family phage prohead protease
MADFILNDENVITSHGFVILNSGGKFDRFRANPVMLDSHDDRCVIGKWNELRIDGSKLIADSEFDTDDPDAKKISGKVDRGYLKGVSMGIYIDDAEFRNVPGLGNIPVVTEWELLEASPVAIPSNKASLKLYARDGSHTSLKAEEIKLSIENIIKSKVQMEKVTLSVEAAKALGLGKNPEETDLNAAIMEMSANLIKANSAKEKAENDLQAMKANQAKELVDLAIKEGRITADKKESFEKLATADFKQAKDLLDSMAPKTSLSGKIKAAGSSAPDREGWDYMRYLKEAPAELAALKVEDPEKFESLRKSYKAKS